MELRTYTGQQIETSRPPKRGLPGISKIGFLLISMAIVLTSLSCSNIQYYDGSHRPDNFSLQDINRQIDSIKKSDPVFDSTSSHFFLDNRLVSVMGVGEYFPGIDINNGTVLGNGTKAIWGSTDLAPDDTLVAWAADYSYKYNSNLLSLNNQTQFRVELSAREIQFLEHFKR